MRYQNIFFDLDGTLTDSCDGILHSARYAFEQLGLPVPETTQLHKMIGPPLAESFPKLGVPPEQVDDAIRLYRVQYVQNGSQFENRVFPGIEALLQQLKAEGCSLYVATTKPESMAKAILEHFGLDQYFAYIAGATMDHSRECKGDVLKYLLELTGRDEKTVLIGDTHYDVNGAGEQGIPCIGVSWGYETTEELRAAGAEAIADSTDELLSYLHSSEVVDERLHRQLNFILEIDQEKNILRQTHISRHGRRENDAEHAWHMAIMAYLLQEYSNEKVDIARVMIMCLLHDVVEIDAGDTYAYDTDGLKTQKAREEAAKQRIYSMLPEDQKELLTAIFDEFEAYETPESRFAHAMDNLQPLLLNNSNDGGDWKEHTVHKAQVYGRQSRTAIGSKKLYEVTDAILQKNLREGNILE